MSGPPRCKPPDRRPRPTTFATPVGSIDTHTHVFEGRYRLTAAAEYAPPDSTLADLRSMHARLGIDRVVFVQHFKVTLHS